MQHRPPTPGRRMRSTTARRHGSLAVTAFILAVGCNDPTDASPTTNVSARRARWTAHGLTSYEYDYEVTGFLINYAGRSIHLVVRADVVQSATDVATGVAEPGAA